MGGLGGLQVHRIWSSRLVYKEMVEALSNYKKSNFWRFGNSACGDSTESKRIEKDEGRVSLVWGKKAEWVVWFSLYGAPLNDWVNGGYVNIYSRIVIVVLFLWGVGPI